MFRSIKRSWAELKQSEPGRRFQDRYRRGKTSRAQSGWRRVLRLGLAIVCLGIGVVLVFIPGPAFVFFIVAGGLLASESLRVARFMDWCETKIRTLWARLRHRRPRPV
ncbi:hypothetical protein DB347_12390 [Opitutaceae bacterium EW11]|nr:hypothetical protein DB347_12390 [Opitutaceae bacterium EW11]